jgi:large subunit ribosomal protein L21
MYAIISDSGRQFRVEKGQEFEVDYRDVQAGDKITFDAVLAVSGEGGLKLGKPTVSGASVTAEVLGARMGDKLVIRKLRRRKNSRRKTGHRQLYTAVRVEEISGS